MKALTYQGMRDVRVETVPDPIIVEPDDVILEVTSTAICGSDLHLYRGKVPTLESGDILGHEFMGRVVERGPGVNRLEVGDRVVVPFVIACGDCFFCSKQLFSACETTNRSELALRDRGGTPPAALFGYSRVYGGIAGGQAEYVRVPKANVGPLRIPDALPDEKVLFLSDILPTGYQAVVDTGVGPGSSLAVFGAGPVGLMAIACARMLGVERIFLVDHHPYRLEFAKATFGVETFDFDQVDDPAREIVAATHQRGVDASIDAVGFEAKGSLLETTLTNLRLEGGSGATLRQCFGATRRGGTVSIPGVYAGPLHAFMLGEAFDKGLRFVMGQTHVQKHMPSLLEAIGEGRLAPDVITSHVVPLEQASEAYEMFDRKRDSCRKVILKPRTQAGVLPLDPAPVELAPAVNG